MRRRSAAVVLTLVVLVSSVGIAADRPLVPPSATALTEAVAALTTPEMDGRHPIKAPLVGTFYRASQPGAPPFVSEGDVVEVGQTVGIVEAMKLMNQVQADQAGTVAEIAVEDGAWVEFEQVLIYLEAAE